MTLTKADVRQLEAFEMWTRQRMKKIAGWIKFQRRSVGKRGGG